MRTRSLDGTPTKRAPSRIASMGIALTVIASAGAALGWAAHIRSLRQAEMRRAVSLVRVIAKGAQDAFQRSPLDTNGMVRQDDVALPDEQALCASADPVPALSVRGPAPYHPSANSGEDFHVGDSHSGWRCLRVRFEEALTHRYAYVRSQDGRRFIVRAVAIEPSWFTPSTITNSGYVDEAKRVVVLEPLTTSDDAPFDL